MIGETSDRGSGRLPEIRICFRGRRAVSLPPWAQAVSISVVVGAAACLAYLANGRIGDKRLAADREAALVRAETAGAALQRSLAALRDELALSARDRHQAQSRVAGLTSEAATRSEQYRALGLAFDQTRHLLQQADAKNAELAARLDRDHADQAAQAAEFAKYRADLDLIAGQLQQLSAGRRAGRAASARLRQQLGGVWQKLSQLRMAPQAAFGSPTRGEIGIFARALAAAGVDVARLFSQFGADPGAGGPFFPPPRDGGGGEAVDPLKLEAIRGVAAALPLAAPLTNYQIGSPFGTRTDPFNRRPAFHTGIDMDAPYRSPVYATAPGTVVFSGYYSDYGNAVEIDHGFGIDTLYAHLQRSLVATGERVAAHAEIGLVGTTGRSSGPHLHYEVRINNAPQDPEKFLELSRLIPAAARPLTPAADARPADSR